jgi:hypothetical protein
MFQSALPCGLVNFCLLMQRVKITGQVFDFEQRSAVYHVQNAVKLSLSLKQGLKRVTIL